MKKLLIISLTLNLILISYGAYKLFNRPKDVSGDDRREHFLTRNDINTSLPLPKGAVLFIGTSITESFPVNEYFDDTLIKNRGIGSNTTENVLQTLPYYLSYSPKKIFLEIGVNDIRYGLTDSLVWRYEKIIDAIRSKNVELYLFKIFPVTGRYESFNDEVDKMNSKLAELASKKNVPLIHVFDKLDSSLTIDGLHLNSKGYEVWRDVVRGYL